MRSKINLYLIEYAINGLLRNRSKNIFIFTIFTLLVFILGSVFLITNSIKYELDQTVDSLPQIIVQNQQAGRVINIDNYIADDILSITGVKSVFNRVWGYYYFQNSDVYFTVVAIDQYETQYNKSLQNIVDKFQFVNKNNQPTMILGEGVKRILDKSYYKKYFNFITPSGDIYKIYFGGVFKKSTNLESNDMIVLSVDDAKTIFAIDEDQSTDIVVTVNNPNEIETIANKIKLKYPNLNIITNNQLKQSYENIFDYKSGIFLTLFIIAIFTFFMIVYDKASGLTTGEKQEIAILKAIGWRVDDILKERFYEASIISIISYILGIFLALLYVYILQAPILKDMFIGYSNLKPQFDIPFVFDIESFIIVFFLTYPIYLAAVLIPSWNIATVDPDEVIR